ncbi:MAG: hypothetical protein QG668_650 [Patescibacteria group bacterium]|nr:hypothetical protein [Patescibacteria group bacterium]
MCAQGGERVRHREVDLPNFPIFPRKRQVRRFCGLKKVSCQLVSPIMGLVGYTFWVIPHDISFPQGDLPETPGVYLMKDAQGEVLYVGKATSLARRVRQHFARPHNALIEEMTRQVRIIEYIQKPSALEALILEANLIKYYLPPYNIREKDQKSFLYLVLTNELYPKPLLIRGNDLESDRRAYKQVFGPYTSGRSLRAALDWLRTVFPWSTCEPGQKKACFEYHLGLCPGVCIEAISPQDYQRIIQDLVSFFEGKKEVIIKRLEQEMRRAAKEEAFERAARLRNQVFALEHIRDIALLKHEDELTGEDVRDKAADAPLLGRVEGFDISHVGGTATVASMVVFEGGQPQKSEYRRFRVRTVNGINDVASIYEVIRRRFTHDWKRPDVLLIDGGLPQVDAARQALHEAGLSIPVLGMIKGPDRKRTDLVSFDEDAAVRQAAERHLVLLTRVRDESHRFAITYHRTLRSKQFLGQDKSG